MTRWANDPDGAADALILRSLPDIAVAGQVLLVEPGRALLAALMQPGGACAVWNRRLAEGKAVRMTRGDAAPWPPAGPFDLALVRLPKARDEVAMTAHATLGTLGAGGRLVLYGGNDEGIRPAAALLEELTGAVESIS